VAEPSVKTVRASETVSPYGPGAIVDILGQSFMVPTGDRWPSTKLRRAIHMERLAHALGVDDLWGAPTTRTPENQNAPGLEFERFPGWLFCQVCRRMLKWTRALETGGIPHCQESACDGRLVPMRFVAVCTSGSHIADVPWPEWMHRSAEGEECVARDKLKFEAAEGRAEGLSSLQVRCERCGHHRTLGELRRDVLLKEGFSCRGKQPWQSAWGTCGRPIDPQQRGATSLHFADVISAIDIPKVESRTERTIEAIRSHAFFTALRAATDPGQRQMLAGQIAADTDIALGSVMAAVDDGATADVRVARSGLLAEEYEAFSAAIAGTSSDDGFHTRPIKLPRDNGDARDGLVSLISDVVLVDRLRDVRTVLGFRRYKPDADLIDAVPISNHERKWLPAVEGHGEGVLLRFSTESVRAWAEQHEVQRRGTELLTHQNASLLGARLHVVSAEYVLLHTFAHLLMRELAFGSGYSAASIRERIYCEAEGDYGIFIYTTSSDSEGTLGGLVRQGESDLLGPAIVRTLEQAAWCPNDPVCIESDPQSIDGLNLAACHACSLASETSCESQNLLLDRALVVGSDAIRGYFEDVLTAILGQRG
jgi:hypothetical protein